VFLKETKPAVLESMKKQGIAILLIFTFAGSFALMWGLLRVRAAHGIMIDYRVVYAGARCLIQNRDPYSETEVLRNYFAEGGERLPTPKPGERQDYLVAVQLYPPTAELFFAPPALLGWPAAYFLWVGLTLMLLTIATFLMWHSCEPYASDPPFYLSCILLVNTGVLFAGANPAGVAVGLCIIGLWCILQQRFTTVGVLCLAVSLAIKPHDSGPIWLYLLLLGGSFRKHALQALTVVATLAVVAVFWVSRVSPNWIGELQSNIIRYSSSGSHDDPAGAAGAMLVNLQALLAVLRNDSGFYNPAAYSICIPLFLIWLFVTLRRPHRTPRPIWLGFAAIASLSLLPVYHRPHDAKILLLTLPACAILWAEGGLIAWTALGFTTAGILITSDMTIAALNVINASMTVRTGVGGELVSLAITRPASPVILAVSIFYLWAYARYSKADSLINSSVVPSEKSRPHSDPQMADPARI
jgi:hypothetical protein